MFRGQIENYISRQLTIYHSAKVVLIPPTLHFFPSRLSLPPNHAVLNSHHYIRSTHNSPKYPQIRQYSSMEIELHPVVSLLPETFSVLVAPLELMAGALNSHLELQRYKVLHVCGNYCLESSAS